MRLLICLGVLSLVACTSPSVQSDLPDETRKMIDSTVRVTPGIDSLSILLDNYKATGNKYGMMRANSQLGKRYRETDRFNEAISCHRQALDLAQQLADTNEIIQTYNQIGTNFRRMGIMDEASTYHYKALDLCEQYSDKSSYMALKSRVVSLNGIGNVHLSMENYNAAISAFRQALSGEEQLNSELGQAINYANIGAIFEKQGMIDSAWVYYRRSMLHNQAARSNLGISLCHTYFGNLLEKDNQWDRAIKEYQSAYDLMEDNEDRWHWIEACIALARVNISKGDMNSAQEYLTRAYRTAKEIQSREHLREVYWLNYLFYEKSGNCTKAFENYKLSREYADSISNIKNAIHLQNVRVNFEKEKSSRELALIQENYQMEQRTKNIILLAGISIILLTIIVIGFLLYVVRIKSKTQEIMRHMETVLPHAVDGHSRACQPVVRKNGERPGVFRLVADHYQTRGSSSESGQSTTEHFQGSFLDRRTGLAHGRHRCLYSDDCRKFPDICTTETPQFDFRITTNLPAGRFRSRVFSENHA